MSAMMAADLGLSFLQYTSAAQVFLRQYKALSDSSFECASLTEKIRLLSKLLPELAKEDRQLADLINWHIFLSSETIRSYKSKSARVRFLNLSKFQKRLKDHEEVLERDLAKVEAKLVGVVDVEPIRLRIAEESRRRNSVDAQFRSLLGKLEREVERKNESEVKELYFRLSVLIGRDATLSEQLRQPVRNYVNSLLDESNAKEKEPWEETGPNLLGLLGLSRVHLLTQESFLRDFTNEHPTYELQLEEAEATSSIRNMLEASDAPTGHLSAQSLVTVDEFTRTLLLIPPEAKTFAFAYPSDNIDHNVDRTALSPVHLFLLHGGYVYFDDNDDVCAGNCFVVDQNNNPFLCFNGPHQLPQDVASELHREGRFHDVTATNLHEQGCQKFCWLCPGEKIATADGKGWGHGAFAYWYGNDKAEHANYYTVATMADVLGLKDSELPKTNEKAAKGFGFAFGAVEEDQDDFDIMKCCPIS